MWDWVENRPRHCLKFGTDSIGWAALERHWSGRRRHRCAMSALSAGMVKPSPTDENLSEPSALATRVRALAGTRERDGVAGGAFFSGLPLRIAVLLPDTAVRVAVLQLDQVPVRREEREALIRWRLGQEQLFPLNGARVVSQVFPNHRGSTERAYTALTVAIQEPVLKQYESLCESVGLIPHEVGVTSLRLADLWRKVSKRSEWQRRDVLWITLSDRALTTMVFQRGQVVFYRCKLLGIDAADVLEKTDMLDKILEDCRASLEVCQQQHPSVQVHDAVICTDGETSVLREQLETQLQLSVQPLGWKSVEALGWVSKGSHPGMTSLAAIAGVL